MPFACLHFILRFQVKLIVVDSFVMPLYPIENSIRKNALVHSALDLLQTIAYKHSLAVSDK